MNSLRKIIEDWCEEYLAGYQNKYEVFAVYYKDLSNKFGMCTWWEDKGKYKFEIQVNYIFEKDNFITKVVLWHEFAHLMDVVKNGNGEHDKGWVKEWVRKPLMTLPAYLLILPIVLYRFIMEDVKK